MSAISAVNRLTRQIAQLETDLARYDENLPQYDRLTAPLRQQIETAKYQIRQIEGSHEYATEQQMNASFAARRDLRDLQARAQARADQLQAEREAFDARINSEIDWRLTIVTDAAMRRRIATDHLRQLDERRERADMLAHEAALNRVLAAMNLTPAQAAAARQALAAEASLAFETRYVDGETGRAYAVVTDADGTTYVTRDFAADSDGEGGGA